MLITLNKSPTHMMGAAEGFTQKFAYYTQDEQVVNQERPHGFLTSAKNLFRYRMTDSSQCRVSE